MPEFLQIWKMRLAVLFAVLVLSTPAGGADEQATYELMVEITWSKETAPFEIPASPHMSRFVGATHRQRYVMFRDGYTASTGLESIAEIGRSDLLKAELAEAQQRKRAGTVFEMPPLKTVPGLVKVRIEATREHSLVSFVTMLAPSPDWFTGVSSAALMADGKWIDELRVPLWAWDAGTDSGKTYRAENQDTQPRESIRLLATPHFLRSDGLTALGMATLKKVR